MIQKMSTFTIKVRGSVLEEPLNLKSPQPIRVIGSDPGATVFKACTDQSGLIGLLRLLHGQGYVLLRIERLDEISDTLEEPVNE